MNSVWPESIRGPIPAVWIGLLHSAGSETHTAVQSQVSVLTRLEEPAGFTSSLAENQRMHASSGPLYQDAQLQHSNNGIATRATRFPGYAPNNHDAP